MEPGLYPAGSGNGRRSCLDEVLRINDPERGAGSATVGAINGTELPWARRVRRSGAWRFKPESSRIDNSHRSWKLYVKRCGAQGVGKCMCTIRGGLRALADWGG